MSSLMIDVAIDNGKKAFINPKWKRQELCKFLEERGLSLSSATADESPLNSLIVLLIRHGAPSGFGRLSLHEAVSSVLKTEAKRIHFLVDLERKRKQLESHLSNHKTFIQETWAFAAAQLQQSNILIPFATVDCLTRQGLVRTILPGFQQHGKVAYLWHDAVDGTYSSIVNRRSTFRNEPDYNQVLLRDVKQYAGEFFYDELNKCETDEGLTWKAESFRAALSPCYTAVEFSKTLDRWAITTGLKMAMEELVESQETDELIEDIRQEIFTSLAEASKDVCLTRAKRYETTRLEEQEETEKRNRDLSSKIKENQEEIARLQKEQSKAKNEMENAKLRKALEEDAWNNFCLNLSQSIPPHELVVQRSRHPIFNIGNAKELVDEAQNFFRLEIDDQRLQYLHSFIEQMNNSATNVLDEVQKIIKSLMGSEPQWSTSGTPWKVFANSALSISGDVLKIVSSSKLNPKEIHLYAARVIYIDGDWSVPGISLALSAPRIQVVGPPRRIVTSGSTTKANPEPKAQSGGGPGLDGTNGKDGECGNSAGHVAIFCRHFEGELRIEANGSNGADGQSGGDGADGVQGSDGVDGSLPGTMKDEKFIFPYLRTAPLHEFSGGTKGVAGRMGGNGGRAGAGGQGGRQGKILLECDNVSGHIDTEARNGSDGTDGRPGQGGYGGKGGRNGLDVARVFEPNALFRQTFTDAVRGHWQEYRGKLRPTPIESAEIRSTYIRRAFTLGRADPIKFVVGYDVNKSEDDSGRAASGERGQMGQTADLNRQRTAVASRDMSRVDGNQRVGGGQAEHGARRREMLVDLPGVTEEERATELANVQRICQTLEAENEAMSALISSTAHPVDLLEDQTIFREKIESLKRLGDRLSESAMKEVKGIQKAAGRVQRTADHVQLEDWDSDSENESSFQPNSSVDVSPSEQRLDRLDQLVLHYAKTDVDQSLALASLTQSLFLLSQNQKLWDAVVVGVQEMEDRPDELIEFLRLVNKDTLVLIELLFSGGSLVDDLRSWMRHHQDQQWIANDDEVGIVRQFNQTPLSYKEIQSVLETLVEEEPSALRLQLAELLERRLVSNVVEQLREKCSITDDPEPWLNRLKQLCLANQQQSSAFYDDLFYKLEETQTTDQNILKEFVTSKLLGIEKLTIEANHQLETAQLERLLFWLDHVDADVDELEVIRAWADQSKWKEINKEMRQTILAKVDHVFKRNHWEPEWSRVQQLQSHSQWHHSPTVTDVAKQLKSAVEWRFCHHQKLPDKMEMCSKLTQFLKEAEDVTAVEQWIQKELKAIYGSSSIAENDTDPTLVFLRLLELVAQHLVENKGNYSTQLLSSHTKRALYLFDQHHISLNATNLGLVKDLLQTDVGMVECDAFTRDWSRLRTIYRIKWTASYSLLHSTDQLNGEFHRIRKEIKKKWKENCLSAGPSANQHQPTSTGSLQMDILLLRYGLMTSWFLSPVDFAHRWQTLEQIQPAGLEGEIKKRIGDEFSSRMDLLARHVQQTLCQHFPGNEIQGETIQHLVNAIVSSLENNYVPGHQLAVISDCLRNLTLLIECRIEDGPCDHPIEDWRKRFAQLSDDKVPSFIKRDWSRMVDVLEWAESQQEKLVAHLNDRIDGNHREMDELLGLLQLFLLRLSHSMPDHCLVNIVNAALEHLGDGQSVNLAAVGQPSQLMTKFIAVWKDCAPEALHPRNDESFLVVLLSPSPGYEKLRLDIVVDFCLSDELLVSLQVVERVANFGQRFIDSGSEPDAVHRVQRMLIERCSAFHHKRFETNSRDDSMDDAIFFEDVERQLQILARFLGETEAQFNQIVLEGLVHLDDADWTNRNAEAFTLKHAHRINPTDADKLAILDAIYAGKFLRPEEVTFVERWIRTGCFRLDRQIEEMGGCIEALRNNQNSVEDCWNRLTSVAGLTVLTEEEKQYMSIAGQEMAEQMLKSEHPSRYLHVLRENCTNKVYAQLMDIYCPQDAIPFAQQLDQLKSYKYIAPPASWELTDHQKSLFVFQKNFERAHFFARLNDVEYKWISWIQEIVIRSLRSYRLPLESVSRFLFASVEFTVEQLDKVTARIRPCYWMQELLVASVCNFVSQLKPDGDGGRLSMVLHNVLVRCSRGWELLEILRSKLEQQAQLVEAEPLDQERLTLVMVDMADLGDLVKDDQVQRFRAVSITQWADIVRETQLAKDWSPGLSSLLVATLDLRLGAVKTDVFLRNFQSKFKDQQEQQIRLQDMLKNLSRSPWIIDEFAGLAEKEDDDEKWELIQDKELIESKMQSADRKPLDARQMVDILNRDPFNQAIMKSLSRETQHDLLKQMESLHHRREQIANDWKLEKTKQRVKEWTQEAIKTGRTEPVEFLAVACRAVKSLRQFEPRDAQLLAFFVFVTPTSSQERRSRMGQISTGEGKTLITALLAIYHALNNWQGKRFVNVVTSSPVLAEENVKEVGELYDMFGVSVGNNCDANCANDEDVRRQRYNNDVIYGDLSSFQRDVLISRFLGRNVTMNREPGAIIVDEVDSMLLDKGENILYMSHKIPELDELLVVFVSIWNAVHAPDVLLGDEEDVALVVGFIRNRLDRKEILVPNCLRGFVDRHISTWIRSAFSAKNQLLVNDAYKIDDLNDGRGQQIVIMDKDTGVEQVQMHWSHGLHQFLQLKHAMKLSPVSMKAVFMSNIAFFNEHEGNLYGLTGTLGSTAECDTLRQVFKVDFFTMPRFMPRFCYEEEALLAGNQSDWLENVNRATKTQLDRDRAVLIVCENITDADAIYSRLVRQEQHQDSSAQVRRYVSSFDKEFQDQQRESPLSRRDVIVATNLAGRGTDFKIDEELADKGGLHVIIAFMPPNARVEAQAQGRTARAGQLGSYQFVLCSNRLGGGSLEDVGVQLERLKTKRDLQESRRLDKIRTQGLQKIFLEEELLGRFHKEIYDVVKKAINSKDDGYVQLQLDFLTNRWAMWLDENAAHVENVHLKDALDVKRKFDVFITSCLAVCDKPDRALLFAQSPTDLLRLGRYFAKSAENNSVECFDRVVHEEPGHCESALIHSAWLVLQNAGHEEKAKAKVLLKKAKLLITSKMDLLLALDDVIKRTVGVAQKAGAAKGENRFNEQLQNMGSVLQIHLMAIEDILGRSVSGAFAVKFLNDAEVKELVDLFHRLDNTDLCKPFRLSKKVSIKDDDVFLQLADGSQKRIEWPFFMAQCKSSIVQVLSAKLGKSADDRSVRKCDFNGAVVARDQLWAMLLEEGLVGDQRDVVKQVLDTGGKPDVLRQIPNDLPEDLMEFQTCIGYWLQQHHGEELSSAITLLPSLTSNQLTDLTDLLQRQGLVVESKEIRGRLLKTLSKTNGDGGHQLPERWRIYQDLLIDWIQSLNGGGDVSLESLPAIKDTEDGVQLIWSHLMSEGVIKDRSLQYPKKTIDEDEVKSRKESVKKAVESIKGIEELCEKYHPTLVIDQVTNSDVLTYLRNDADAASSFVDTQFGELKKNPVEYIADLVKTNKLKEYGEENKETIKRWLTKYKKRKQLDSFVAQLVSALINSAGQLRTMPSVSASLRPLSEYFPDRYPPELDDFKGQLFDRVVVLKKYKFWWDWKAFWVAMLGTVQITLGATIIVSNGSLSSIGNVLIAEGVEDVIMAIQGGLTGTFSWQAYKTSKLWSGAMIILSGGINTYKLLKTVAKSSQMYLKSRNAWTLMRKVGKRVLISLGKGVNTAMSSLAINKFLAFLKKHILDRVLAYIRDNFVSQLFCSALQEMDIAMDALREKMSIAGKSLHDIKAHIRRNTFAVNNTELHSIWLQQLARKVSTLGNRSADVFADESSSHPNTQGQQEKKSFNIWTSVFGLVAKFPVTNEATKADMMGKAGTAINYLTTGAEMVSLIAHGPEYVMNVNRDLVEQAKFFQRLNVPNGEGGSMILRAPQALETEEVEFKDFKKEMEKTIQDEILKHLVDGVKRAWLEPYLQYKMGRVVDRVNKQTMEFIGSLFDDNDKEEYEMSEGSKETQQQCQRDKNGKPFSQKKKKHIYDYMSLDENDSKSLDDETTRSQTDQSGGKTTERKSFEEFVDSIGKRKAGPMVFQLTANATGRPVQIVEKLDDDYGICDVNTFKPNGKESDQPPIVFDHATDPDGSSPKSNVRPHEENVEMPVEGSTIPKPCFYGTAAQVTANSVDKLVADLKAHAIYDRRFRYVYDQSSVRLKAGVKWGLLEVKNIRKHNIPRTTETSDSPSKKKVEELIAKFNTIQIDKVVGQDLAL